MFRLEVSGQAEVSAYLGQVSEALSPTKILDELSAVLLSRIRQRFLTEVGPDGRPWIPSFAARLRAKSGRGGGTLFASGKLFNSIQEFSDTENSRLIGTDVPYAKWLHFGTKYLPKRPFIGIAEQDERVMEGLLLKRVAGALK